MENIPNQKKQSYRHPKITLLKISFAVSVIGILLLLFLSSTIPPKKLSIIDINNNHLNKRVQVQGTIFSIKTYQDSDFQVISIKDQTGSIDITTNKIFNITKSQQINVIGKVKEYKQNLQIQADKITVS